jgi:hypothetical protein
MVALSAACDHSTEEFASNQQVTAAETVLEADCGDGARGGLRRRTVLETGGRDRDGPALLIAAHRTQP